jgi:hypothetical protein
MASTLARFESSGLLPVGLLKTLAAPVDNKEALHHRIVNASQTIRNHPGVFEWMGRSMVIRIETCIESRRRYFEHFSLSAISHKLNVSGYMAIWTFFLVFTSGTCAQNLFATFSYTLYSCCDEFINLTCRIVYLGI